MRTILIALHLFVFCCLAFGSSRTNEPPRPKPARKHRERIQRMTDPKFEICSSTSDAIEAPPPFAEDSVIVESRRDEDPQETTGCSWSTRPEVSPALLAKLQDRLAVVGESTDRQLASALAALAEIRPQVMRETLAGARAIFEAALERYRAGSIDETIILFRKLLDATSLEDDATDSTSAEIARYRDAADRWLETLGAR